MDVERLREKENKNVIFSFIFFFFQIILRKGNINFARWFQINK